MRRLILALSACLLTAGSATAAATGSGSHYVTARTLNVRLAPAANAKITNRLYRQNRVEVFEVRDGWARISRYYNGRVEGISGNVARWVAANHLATQRPDDLKHPAVARDSRISGIPKVGQGGLTRKDVQILHRGARHFLDSGRCNRIAYGDKSVSKPNTYYVNCGSRNHFFTPSDLPRG